MQLQACGRTVRKRLSGGFRTQASMLKFGSNHCHTDSRVDFIVSIGHGTETRVFASGCQLATAKQVDALMAGGYGHTLSCSAAASPCRSPL